MSFSIHHSRINQIRFLSGLVLVILFTTGCQTTGSNSLDSTPDAINLEQEAVATVPELIKEGDTAIKQNKPDIAKIKYALALDKDKNNIDAMYALGVLHSGDGSLSLAEGLLRKVRTINPGHLDAREALGSVLLKQKRIAEAEILFEEALESRPNSLGVLNAMGIIKDMKAEHIEAQAMFKAAIFQQPNSAKTRNNLGYSFYLSGDLLSAENEFLQAIDLDANYAQAWSNLALVYSRQGEYVKARSAFGKIVSDHQAANNIGYLGLLNDDSAIAAQELNRAVTLSPSYYQLANENLEVLEERRRQSGLAKRSNNISRSQDRSNDTISESNSQQPSPRVFIGSNSSNATRETVAGKREAASNGLARLSSREIQMFLNFLGFNAGEVDGILGDSTKEAIEDFQTAEGLIASGKWTAETRVSLKKRVVIKVQESLAMLGFEPGEIDGVNGSATRTAIREFQRAQSLPVTGNFDQALLSALSDSISQNIDFLSDPNTLDTSARG